MKKAIVIIVALVILAGGGYLIFHKSDNKNSTTGSTSTSSQQTKNAGTTIKDAATVIKTATSSSLGQYLTDDSGKPLYTYGGDTVGKSNCTGSCVASWPVYTVTVTSGKLPANVGQIKLSDGTSQYTYKGLPLYYFSSDSANNPTGDGLSDFHLAKP